jgi:hypothetical protein
MAVMGISEVVTHCGFMKVYVVKNLQIRRNFWSGDLCNLKNACSTKYMCLCVCE